MLSVGYFYHLNPFRHRVDKREDVGSQDLVPYLLDGVIELLDRVELASIGLDVAVHVSPEVLYWIEVGIKEGSGMRRSFVQAMQNDALDGPNHIQFPAARDMQLAIQPFDGRETYSGLGAPFTQWGYRFLRQLSHAQQASGGIWSEEVKLDCLGRHLSGRALTYYEQQVTQWMTQCSSVEEVMDRINEVFRLSITRTQVTRAFTAKNSSGRSWNEHFLFLSAVSEAVGVEDDMLLESVIKYANPEFKQALMARVNTMREDTRRQAEELCHFAQLMDSDSINNAPREAKRWMRDRISAIRETKPKKEINCYSCGKSGHMKRECRNKNSSNNEDIVLGIGSKDSRGQETEKARKECNECCILPNGKEMKMGLTGSVKIIATVNGLQRNVLLNDVQHAKNLPWNIVSYGKLEAKGCKLKYQADGSRAVQRTSDGAIVFERQHSVSLSTMEAEFVAASKAAQELLGARELFKELKINVKEPMILWMDNQAAISQQYMDKRIIAPTYVHTSKMLADLHTKEFLTPRFLQLRDLWQLRNWTLQVEDDTNSSATTKEGVLKGPKIKL
uniref:Mitochondrial Carrier (MC) Family putative n=1 Tax=Albugo laibachii Nc14 TaxID=890382 RepID=F0WMD6_9STRA|nr:Mitochondrial Carrier (MC) Family putative [Albugo laibachii Nc14]|eukprot:CCA22467.1 Mitochondrial Carrier (MC) Family putative [Albugo laibachii Nc14]